MRFVNWTVVPVIAMLGCAGKDDSAAIICATHESAAGDDQSLGLGVTVHLDGSGSQVCDIGNPTYHWNFDSVPVDSTVTNKSLSEDDTKTASHPAFTPDIAGTYVLSLVIADGPRTTPADVVVVDVHAGDLAPIADSGPDVTGIEGELQTFDGTGSFDPEGAPLTYVWSLTSAPPCSELTSGDVLDGSGPHAKVVPDCGGRYVMSLVVSDGAQWSGADFTVLDVTSQNTFPIADAGQGGDVSPCAGQSFPLNGYASYDLDGDTLSYAWAVDSAPKGSTVGADSFSDATLPDPTFTWDVDGTYILALQVFDGEVWSAPDLVTFQTGASVSNTTPIANAGEDIDVVEDGGCVYTGVPPTYYSCSGCDQSDFDLDGSGSFDANGDSLQFHWTGPGGDLTIHSPFSALSLASVAARSCTYNNSVYLDFAVTLTVADCEGSSSDSMQVSYTCDAYPW